jgi:TRAP-type mannitol/chloroaromatic compound transport system substrate-binding protein
MFQKKSLTPILVLVASVFFLQAVFSVSAIEAKTLRWRMGTTWTPSIDLIQADRHFVEIVNDLSGGDLKIKLFSAGELVPAFELFDAVATGTLQAGGDWPNYWSGKSRAFDALGSYPMGLTPIDYAVWIYQYGGLEYYQKVYGKHGLYYLPYAVTPMESGVRSNKPIQNLKDYKGLKIRMSGKTQGQLLEKLGAAQTMLSGGEIYQALEKGVIDAAEFSSPSNDWGMGFNEVTKYWATPGWHQPASVLGVMINKKVWDELSEDHKNLLKHAAMANFLWSYTYFEKGAVDATEKFIADGTKVSRLSDDELKEIQEITNKLTLETAKKDPLFAEVIYAQYEYLEKMARWRGICQPFTFGRNIQLPDMEALKQTASK